MELYVIYETTLPPPPAIDGIFCFYVFSLL